jgi:antitoxin HicB
MRSSLYEILIESFREDRRMKYTVVIQWSDEDQCYIASLPEFGRFAHTQGDTYEEALTTAQEVLESLIEQYQSMNKSLPVPRKFELSLVA